MIIIKIHCNVCGKDSLHEFFNSGKEFGGLRCGHHIIKSVDVEDNL